MHVELITAPECPHADDARSMIADCLAQLDLTAQVIETVGPYPSPTVLVDGEDVMGRPAGRDANACRLDLPTRERVMDAMRASLAGPLSDDG
ncbi:MAG: alkylmercury lyase [Actinophytocola sp.]|nr:alkylmercury lyase [Actinophytocola sp.]